MAAFLIIHPLLKQGGEGGNWNSEFVSYFEIRM